MKTTTETTTETEIEINCNFIENRIKHYFVSIFVFDFFNKALLLIYNKGKHTKEISTFDFDFQFQFLW